MALIEQTLFGERDKVALAMRRLQEFVPAEQPYWLAFSGGKRQPGYLSPGRVSRRAIRGALQPDDG